MRERVYVGIFFVIGSVAACGGAINGEKNSNGDPYDGVSGDDDGGDGYEGGIDYYAEGGTVFLPDGGFANDCPLTKPSTGDPCSIDYSQCEYGDDLFYDCNTIAVCEQGAWSVIEGSTSSICSKTYVNPPDCPKTSDAVPVGSDCSTFQTCLYLDDPHPRLCTCSPDGMGDETVWGCYEPQAGCPASPNRPRLGTPCSTEDLECDYGSCVNYTNVLCQFGSWGPGADLCADENPDY